MNDKRKKIDSELAKIETHQESILQALRNLHYVFQTVFLGIAFTLIAIGFTILFNNSYEQFQLYIFPTLIIALIFVWNDGRRLMNEYSNLIYKRGLIIDLTQHLRIIEYQGKIDEFLGYFLKTRHEGEFFILIKLAERIATNSATKQKSKNFKEALGARLLDEKCAKVMNLLPLHEDNKNLHIFVYALLYNDIFSTKYISEISDFEGKSLLLRETNIRDESSDIQTSLRIVTDSRNGNRKVFSRAWLFVMILSILLMAIVLLKFFFQLFS